MNETGVVKFSCEQRQLPLGEFPGFAELNASRAKLQELGVLGVDASGIGFGNISVRDFGGAFYITGSGTGALPVLTTGDYARVTAYDFAANRVWCDGGTIASAESLTHAAVYESDPSVHAVIHGHSSELWKRLEDQVPATAAAVEYGTPAMANEVRRLFAQTDVRARKIFITGGHVDGFVTFGATTAEALGVLLEHLEQRAS